MIITWWGEAVPHHPPLEENSQGLSSLSIALCGVSFSPPGCQGTLPAGEGGLPETGGKAHQTG